MIIIEDSIFSEKGLYPSCEYCRHVAFDLVECCYLCLLDGHRTDWRQYCLKFRNVDDID